MKSTPQSNGILGHLASDASASIAVFLVALPLCLGVAVASDAPPFAGIIAGVIGGIIVGYLSGSHVSVSGPAAGLTVIVATAIGVAPSYQSFLLAVFLAGIFQVIFGILKGGFLGQFIPSAVIKGMLAAIGLILILKQIPHLLGDDRVPEGDEEFIQTDGENTLTEIIVAFQNITPLALALGVVSILLLIFWESKKMKQIKFIKLLPGSLVVVALGIIIQQWAEITFPNLALSVNHLVKIPVAKDFQEFTSFFTSPNFNDINQKVVWISALTIAIVASLESLLSIEASDKIDPFKRFTPPNRELIAQGSGNIVTSLLGGLPVTAVIVRSSANISAGNKTKMSAILHGVLLLLFVYFAPNLLNKIPLASLAAVLIFVGYKLTKPSIFLELSKKGISQIVPFIVTIVAILFTDLLIGILIGIATGLFFTIRSNFRNAFIIVNEQEHYLIRFKKDITFIHRSELKKQFDIIPNDSKLLLDISRSEFIDNDILELIEDFSTQAKHRNIIINYKLGDKSINLPV